jgi:manganese transport protein
MIGEVIDCTVRFALMQQISTESLSEVHGSVDPSLGKSPWRKIAAFFGPAYLVSVGYMDPGNWATDLQGGAQFGYKLLWVLVMSNIMALLLQSLSARLGIVSRRDLAQCNREVYPRGANYALYVLAELAIAACDLAEVLGMAIGLNLLLHIPLLWGVTITLLDTLLLLYLQKLGMRKLEAFIIALVAIIGVCFLVELIMAKPAITEIATGLIPSIPNSTALYIAIGIIGATVMPHNLYLHSALVQTRKVKRDDASLRSAIKFNTWDSAIALNMALFVNAAILILAASVFYNTGHHEVAALKDAHRLLHGILGSKWSSHLFAIALIAAGQSSTITGTLAGQIVMEGYLRLRINPWMRRMITRLLAIVPSLLVIWLAGEDKVDDLLVFSQVLLSMQLAFAVIPLIHFVSSKSRMGKFAIGPITQFFSWLVAVVIIVLNIKLVYQEAVNLIIAHPQPWAFVLVIAGGAGMALLLGITIVYPMIRKSYGGREIGVHPAHAVQPTASAGPGFSVIALALDYSVRDSGMLRYALQLAQSGTRFVLIHIVESAAARTIGAESDDFETIHDKEQLAEYAEFFSSKGFEVTSVLGYKYRAREIARIVNEEGAELLIVGSHGHKAFSDWLFGETINSVRHIVKIPIFIAQ